jgi:hypothetical protein
MFVFLCCVVLCSYSSLRRAEHTSKEVLPSVLTRLRNLLCETTKILTRTDCTTDDDDDTLVFGVVTPCSLVSGYQHFGEMYHLHLQDRSVTFCFYFAVTFIQKFF